MKQRVALRGASITKYADDDVLALMPTRTSGRVAAFAGPATAFMITMMSMSDLSCRQDFPDDQWPRAVRRRSWKIRCRKSESHDLHAIHSITRPHVDFLVSAARLLSGCARHPRNVPVVRIGKPELTIAAVSDTQASWRACPGHHVL